MKVGNVVKGRQQIQFDERDVELLNEFKRLPELAKAMYDARDAFSRAKDWCWLEAQRKLDKQGIDMNLDDAGFDQEKNLIELKGSKERKSSAFKGIIESMMEQLSSDDLKEN